MKIEKAVEIVTKYDDYQSDAFWNDDLEHCVEVPDYANDLNSLVPVWEKLNLGMIESRCWHTIGGDVVWEINIYPSNFDESSTLQKASCIATAEAILYKLGLGNENQNE